MSEVLTLINGNNQKYTRELPTIVILEKRYNDTALQHIYDNTGLRFTGENNMTAIPETSQQIVKLFLTYNFKTQYHDNATNHNTLFLKSDHHIGFQVDSICYDCVKENHIITNGLERGDRLSC
jgi:hypothetical protein